MKEDKRGDQGQEGCDGESKCQKELQMSNAGREGWRGCVWMRGTEETVERVKEKTQ